jgi:hypothetical protein
MKCRASAASLAPVVLLPVSLLAPVALAGCGTDVQAMDAQQIERQYGVPGASDETVDTPDGPVKGTRVPIVLAGGRPAYLFIPQNRSKDPHALYLQDAQGLHPVQLRQSAGRDEIARAPGIVETKSEPAHAKRHSWEKDALIIGGSAGAGTAIGAIAGGKKGAGVGAAAGGVGGLIYDLLARKQK